MRLRLKNCRLATTKRLDFQAIEAYGEKLEAQGWKYSISNGGYVSPDRSAIYYTNRSPYYGMVMQNSENGDFAATISELDKTGDFESV